MSSAAAGAGTLARPRLVKAMRLTIAAFNRDNASRFGAAMAFYIVFSIVPIVLITIAVAGRVFGRDLGEQEIAESLAGTFGSAAGAAIAVMIEEASARPVGWIASILALSSLYFGLSGIYRQIDDALRTIWRKEHTEDEPAPPEKRFASMLLVAATGAVMLLSAGADAVIAATGRYASSRLVGGEFLWHTVQLLASTVVLSFLFATVFRYLPQARISWQRVRVGAVVTAILFVIGKFGLGFYLGKAAVGSAFGAAGSIVVVLLWAYWSAQIFFFGLEFTHIYARRPT